MSSLRKADLRVQEQKRCDLPGIDKDFNVDVVPTKLEPVCLPQKKAVGEEGFEPSRIAPLVPKTSAYTVPPLAHR